MLIPSREPRASALSVVRLTFRLRPELYRSHHCRWRRAQPLRKPAVPLAHPTASPLMPPAMSTSSASIAFSSSTQAARSRASREITLPVTRAMADGQPARSLTRRNRSELLHYGLAVDAAGDVYIPDAIADRVRKVSSSGTISTVAGNGTVDHEFRRRRPGHRRVPGRAQSRGVRQRRQHVYRGGIRARP